MASFFLINCVMILLDTTLQYSFFMLKGYEEQMQSGGDMMKRFIRIAMLLCVVIVLLSALSLKTIEAKATASSWKGFQNRFSSTSCNWSVVPSPNPNGNGGLSGVAAASATDIWAVGGYGSQLSSGQTLIEHWDGAHWQIV